MPYDLEKNKIKIRLWLGVILTFIVVLGVWAVQLKIAFPKIETASVPSGLEQELKNSKAELGEIINDLQPVIQPIKQLEKDTEKFQNAVLENMKEKISEKNAANDSLPVNNLNP